MTDRFPMLAVIGLIAVRTGWAASVLDFGAVPDGRTDNTEAIRKALDSGAKEILVPAGRYRTRGVSLPAQVRLRGEGPASVLVLADGEAGAFLLDAGDDGAVENLALTAERSPVAQSRNEALCLIRIRGKSGVTVRNVRCSDGACAGIGCREARDLTIAENDLRNLNEGIRLEGCSRAQILANRVTGMAHRGIEFRGIGGDAFGREGSADLLVSGNHVKDGGAAAIRGAGTVRAVLANNMVDGAGDTGLALEGCRDSIISGNTVGNGGNGGIALSVSCARVSIAGNTVLNDRPVPDEEAAAAWWVRSGIWLSYPNRETVPDDAGHRDISIVGNTVHCAEGPGRRAIWIGSESDNVTLYGNALSGGGVWYGGEHNVRPMTLVQIPESGAVRPPFRPGLGDAPRFRGRGRYA